MTSWAKNQIAKHLARFAKNVDPSQISLKFLRGEGELSNLELNEQVLSDLLELPPWLHLTKATCNRISAKIRWTSLKTDPIRLYLDCVNVEICVSEVERKRTEHVPVLTKPQKERPIIKPNKYGFAEKVADGMYVSINTVMVLFKSVGFKATLSVSRIIIQSTTPDWTAPNNLRQTRIKDDQRGLVLIFKEVRWGTMKLDADASYREEFHIGSTPLRLITNNSSIHITIKKRLSDCGLVSSRLEVILDDILWVLTQSQLLKLSSFVHYLLKLREKNLPLSTPVVVDRTASNSPAPRPSPQASGSQHDNRFHGQGTGSSANQLFLLYDVAETSYHVNTKRIDLHLCDDKTLDGQKKQTTPRIVKGIKRKRSFSESGGALQITFSHLCIDHYPYHIAGSKRSVWRTGDESLFARRQWAQQLLANFMKQDGRQARVNHTMRPGHDVSTRHHPVMFESFFLLSARKFEIMEVTTTGGREGPKPFLSSDKESLYLPDEMNAFFIDYTTYYYMGGIRLPVPPANLFLQLNPVQLRFHPLTCVWLNKFVQSVIAGLEWTKEFMAKEVGPPEHIDIRIEALMPKIVIPCEPDPLLPHMEERPKALQITISQAVVTNCRIGSVSSQSELLMDLQTFLASNLYSSYHAFPNENNDLRPLPNSNWVNDYSLVHRAFLNVYHRKKEQMRSGNQTSRDVEIPYHIWCIWCEQIWIDFMDIENAKGRPVTFVDAVPIRLWLSVPVPAPGLEEPSDSSSPKVDKRESGIRLGQHTLTETDQGSRSGSQHALTADSSTTDLTNNSVSFNSPRSETNIPIGQSHSIVSDYRAASSSTDTDTSLAPGYFDSSFSDNKMNARLYPLRSSYSESNLMPAHHSHDKNVKLDETTSLKDFSFESSTIDGTQKPLTSAGPPPPYFADSASPFNSPKSASDTAMKCQQTSGRNRRSSITSLPPSYDMAAAEAPPLPHKMPIDVETSEAILNYFNNDTADGSAGESNVTRKYPAMSGLLAIAKTIFVQMDHFQLVFLLRIQEMFGEVGQKISEDSARFAAKLNNKKETVSASFLLHLTIPLAEISLILPPCQGIEEVQKMTLMERIKEGNISRLFQSIGLNLDDNMTTVEQKDSSESDKQQQSSIPHTEIETCSNKMDRASNCSNEIDDSSGISSSSGSPPLSGNNWLNAPISDASNTIVNSNGAATEDSKHVGHIDIADDVVTSIEDNKRENSCGTQDNVGDSVVDVASSTSNESEPGRTGIESERNETGRNSFLTVTSANALSNSSTKEGHITFDNNFPRWSKDVSHSEAKAVNHKIESVACLSEAESKPDIEEDNKVSSDSSTQTEASTQTGDGVPNNSDTANRDRSMSLMSSFSTNDRLVSILCITCNHVKLAVETEDEDTVVKVVSGGLQLKERNDIKYTVTLDHRLNTSYEDEDRAEKVDLLNINSDSSVQVRLVTGPKAEMLAPGAAELGFAAIKVCGLDASLLLSNTDSLAEFGEDECLTYGLPFVVELKGCNMQLMDDKPRRYLSTPLPPPLKVCIEMLTVQRSTDGTIRIFSTDVADQETGDTTVVSNSDLPAMSILSTTDSSSRLNELENENERLIEDFKVGNARMLTLEQERDSLLKVIEKLQQELLWTNDDNYKLQTKVKAFQQYFSGHQGYYRR